ncbi:MAG: replicative DNA helicase [Planctomycetes bacterium]|nr:replicative DNA helicase [Planctomycetota bacterium]
MIESTQSRKPFERTPPHSEDAEKSLLGALLLDGDLLHEVMLLVQPEDFYGTAHQRIFEACVTLARVGSRIDATLVREQLVRTGDLEKVGGEDYLAQLVLHVPSAVGASEYARIVSERAVRRSLLRVCTEIQESAYEGSLPGDQLLDRAEDQVFGLSRGAAGQETVGIHSVLMETFDEINRLIESGGGMQGLPTGYFRIDQKTSGLHGGSLIIVAGRPSMGKTTFSNCLVDHIAVVERKPVVYFSLEVSRQHLVRNMLCARARVDLQRVRNGEIEGEDHDKLTRAAGELMEAPIFIDDTSGASAMQIRAKARRVKQKHGLSLVVVDYLQLMSTGRGENRQQEISELSRSLKGMARELDVPVIAISQLNRSVDSREDRRPRMSDLRESGRWSRTPTSSCSCTANRSTRRPRRTRTSPRSSSPSSATARRAR